MSATQKLGSVLLLAFGWLAIPPATAGAVTEMELESNGEPDVLLHLYSGGAHCCYVDQVFSPSVITAPPTDSGNTGRAVPHGHQPWSLTSWT
jgi:hypothetical protein